MAAGEDPSVPPQTLDVQSLDADFVAFSGHKMLGSPVPCGIVLVGSEVKSLRDGKGQLQESYARIEKGQLVLHGCHIDPYAPATKFNHEPLRERRLVLSLKRLLRAQVTPPLHQRRRRRA